MSENKIKKKIAVIGGGIAGLSGAYALEKEASVRGTNIAIDLFEKKHRMGGNILTERVDDFVIEGGPDCVYSEKPASLDLCEKLNLGGSLLKTREEKKGTFVYDKGKLHDLPDGVILMIPTMIMPILFSSLISFKGKLRMGLEPFIPKRTDPTEETLSQFVNRRLGRELLDKIAEPLVAGIHAGNPETMSINASFPRFVDLEQKYGSLIRGMLTRKKQMAAMKKGNKPKYTMFMTLKNGLQDLTDKLQSALTNTTKHIETKVIKIEKKSDGYQLFYSDNRHKKYDSILIAAPAYSASRLVEKLYAPLADELSKIPYVSTATVSLAYSSSSLEQIQNGFGFLAPRISNRKIMAATYTSNKFSCRAPEGSSLLRCFVGGARNEELASMDDKDMAKMVQNELKEIAGIDAKPLFSKVYRWKKSMPQYVTGHIGRIKKIEEMLLKCPGLYLAGSAYNGIGISDSIVSSQKAAESAINFIS